MKRKALLSLCFLAPVSHADQMIRVRLASGLQSVEIAGEKIQVWLDNQKLPDTFEKSVRIEGNLFLAGNGKGRDLEVRGKNLRLGRLDLPGRVHFIPKKDGVRFDLISHLDLEEYLMGVLPSEMPLSWPLEALKAQVVAARSFALALVQERRHNSFDVESSVLDQAYQARHRALNEARWRDQARLAVQSTKAEVLKNGSLVLRAHYHSDCGGKTELASRVWGVAKNTENPKVKSCVHGESTQWKLDVKKDLLARQLKDRNSSGLVEVRIASRNSSQRVDAIDLIFKDGTRWKVSSQELRRVVGFSRIKSTNFNLVDHGEIVTFEGRGNGHGVGMCQFGARAMAREGKSYREILKFYFPTSGLEEESLPVFSVSGF